MILLDLETGSVQSSCCCHGCNGGSEDDETKPMVGCCGHRAELVIPARKGSRSACDRGRMLACPTSSGVVVGVLVEIFDVGGVKVLAACLPCTWPRGCNSHSKKILTKFIFQLKMMFYECLLHNSKWPTNLSYHLSTTDGSSRRKGSSFDPKCSLDQKEFGNQSCRQR